MNTAVVSREKLRETVKLAVLRVVPGTCFVSGLRKVNGYNGKHQMMAEIVQLKYINPEDAREDFDVTSYIGGSNDSIIEKTVRVCVNLTLEGYERTLPQLAAEKSGVELHELVGKLTSEQVLMILSLFDQVRLDSGAIVTPTIAVKQYSNVEGDSFPQKLAKIIETAPEDRTIQQEEDLKSATMRTAEGELLVDQFGQQVYEVNKFTYGAEENIFVKKMSINKYYNYVFGMKATETNQLQTNICVSLSSNELILWTSELIEKYEDKWDWNELNKNASIPWTLKLINKYADKLSCSESIWKTLKPYIDDKLIEEVFKEINKSKII